MPEPEPLTFDDVVAAELKILRGDQPDRPLSALCVSGGGIRSATFALGAIQGLADQGVLEEFDYLSTVSGGGYIGAWLTSWKHREKGLHCILPKLRTRGSLPKPEELDPIGHLREYNNYLTPKMGFLSADMWTLAATVIRNMTLNWLVFVPLLMCALTIPRIILSVGRLGESMEDVYGHRAAVVLASISNAIPFIGGALFAIAIFNTMRYLPSVGGKDHTETDFLKFCLAPILLAAQSFMTYDSWFYGAEAVALGRTSDLPPFWRMLIWITSSCALGWIAYLAICVRGIKARFRMLFGPLSLAVLLTGSSTGTAAWLLSSDLYPTTTWASYITMGPALLLISFMGAGGLFVGLTSTVLEDEDREWLSRGAAWMLQFVVCWAGLCGLVLIAPAWIFSLGGWARTSIAAAGGIAGWLCAVAGAGAPMLSKKEAGKDEPSLKSLALDWVAKAAAPIFVAVVLVSLSILTNWIMATTGLVPEDWTKHEIFLEQTRPEAAVAIGLIFMAIGWISARFININIFSLHAMYRSRLIRAYLGASNDRSKANRFTGFANSDNIRMDQLAPDLKPFHVVNITLNLVAGKRLAWQQRKAESFTVTPLHAGSARLGYRPASGYGGKEGISLGTAITISGAAASPNMGYHSSGVIGFIMTLFNARLGAWLGNPGEAGAHTWRKSGPSSAIGSLVKEAFGLTNDTSSYVYLSDGGHFENLGIYEMIMRRCGRIVVLDSGCDADFVYEDLGNALRKIRIDKGIPIDFDDALMAPLRKREKRCAVATIRYSAVNPEHKDGLLIYIKPMMTGNEPPDVTTYHSSHAAFPHQGTGNQWYDEAQTESYRMLGLHTIQEICGGWKMSGGLGGLFDHARETYLGCGRAVAMEKAAGA